MAGSLPVNMVNTVNTVKPIRLIGLIGLIPQKKELVDKPGSVAGNHSSATSVAGCL